MRTPRLFDFEPARLARTETAMWQAYYDRKPAKLFRLSVRLLQEQLGYGRARAFYNAYRLTRAAFAFKVGRSRIDYEKALRWLVPFYQETHRMVKARWNPQEVAESELEWWIIHRHDFQPGQTANLEKALAKLCGLVYHLPESELSGYARYRAEAMLLTDEGVRARERGEKVTPQWSAIREYLEKSYRDLSERLNRSPQDITGVKRILAVKLADLGDALLVVPALRALKQAYPAARLDVLTTETGQKALAGLPYIDKLIVFDKYLFDYPREALKPQNLKQALAFLAWLRQEGYDTTIFFHHFSLRFGILKYRAVAGIVGAKRNVGLHNGEPLANFLNVRVEDKGFGGEGLSERDYWRQLVEALTSAEPGRPFEYDPRPEIHLEQAARTGAQKLLAELRGNEPQRPLIAIGAGGGGYTIARRWPAANYARLVRVLIEQKKARIALLGTPGEFDLNEQIRALAGDSGENGSIFNLAGRTSEKEVTALLAGCDLFVGNDGGLAQLAGVAGIAAVVIFGPTNATAWQPFGTEEGRVKIVQARMDLPCRPCLYRGKTLGSRLGCAARPCLTTLTPGEVLETINGLALSYKKESGAG